MACCMSVFTRGFGSWELFCSSTVSFRPLRRTYVVTDRQMEQIPFTSTTLCLGKAANVTGGCIQLMGTGPNLGLGATFQLPCLSIDQLERQNPPITRLLSPASKRVLAQSFSLIKWDERVWCVIRVWLAAREGPVRPSLSALCHTYLPIHASRPHGLTWGKLRYTSNKAKKYSCVSCGPDHSGIHPTIFSTSPPEHHLSTASAVLISCFLRL